MIDHGQSLHRLWFRIELHVARRAPLAWDGKNIDWEREENDFSRLFMRSRITTCLRTDLIVCRFRNDRDTYECCCNQGCGASVKTVARKLSIGGIYVCAGGFDACAGGTWHSNQTKIPLIYVSCFNLGDEPTKTPPWRRDWPETEQCLMAGSGTKHFLCCNRSLKFGFRCHGPSLWANCTNNAMLFSFQWTKLWSRNQKLPDAEARGLKFGFRLHRPGCNRPTIVNYFF